ncbi:hypothetical protein [Bacillus cereus group sp. TH152-1LC]|uniref:hypothetical protein n=1 Tax=Bacillus cereus group sp. TH152-1LC TaxID=3018060 RepID=UPI0022DFC152|nr:hypothetical protein [Bacillus cereus group sp. TH152-1LC]MDA1675737.1 hypothetical protein [Bacillus cereus group sp. TH152-1LC]
MENPQKNVCGYALIEIDDTGKKARMKEFRAIDGRLQDYLNDYYQNEGIGHDGAGELQQQLPQDLKDVLVLVTFNYTSIPAGPWEAPHSEYEDVFSVVNHTVMQWNYKEFFRKQVTHDITLEGHIQGNTVEEILSLLKVESTNLIVDVNWAEELVESWELFYDEDLIIESIPKEINTESEKIFF